MAIMRFDKLGKLISEDIALFKEKYGKNLKCYKYAHLPIHGIQALKKLRKNGLPDWYFTVDHPMEWRDGNKIKAFTISLYDTSLDDEIVLRYLNETPFCRSDSGSMGQAQGAPTVPDGTYIWLCDVLNTSSTFALVQCLSLD